MKKHLLKMINIKKYCKLIEIYLIFYFNIHLIQDKELVMAFNFFQYFSEKLANRL